MNKKTDIAIEIANNSFHIISNYEEKEISKIVGRCYVNKGKRELAKKTLTGAIETVSCPDFTFKNYKNNKNLLTLMNKYFPELSGKTIARNSYENPFAAIGDEIKEEVIKVFNANDIVVSSWGYDQTNVDFYRIIKRTEKSVTIRRLKSKVTITGYMSGTSLPLNEFEKDSKELTRKIHVSNAENKELYVKISSFSFAYLWDKTPAVCSWYA